MRAPLVIPALLLLDAIVLARDSKATLFLAAIAITATTMRPVPERLVGASAVAIGLLLGVWREAPMQLEQEIAGAEIRGTVISDVEPKAWGESFELRGADGRLYAVSVRDTVAIGERLMLHGDLEPFDEARNPGETSASDFARERGLFARLAHARVLARSPAHFDVRTICPRIRAAANLALHRLLAEPDATILAGMLYGARGTLAPELRSEFQDTGTVHILVTAGLHLGVVAGLVTWIFARIGVPRVPAALAAIPLIWAYAAISGGHVPSLRAAAMVTVGLCARALGERTFSANTLALAAIVVAAIWPAWVGGASFALSFSCVGAIVLFAEPISDALEHLRLPGILREALALTCATQIGVWPLTAATFLVIAPYAPLANLFVVPVVGIALVGGIVMLAVSAIPVVSAIAAHVETWPLAWIESAVHLTSQLPLAHVIATPPPDWTLACYDVAMIVAGVMLRTRRNTGISAP